MSNGFILSGKHHEAFLVFWTKCCVISFDIFIMLHLLYLYFSHHAPIDVIPFSKADIFYVLLVRGNDWPDNLRSGFKVLST